MSSGDWDPEQYQRFASERSQPFHDLIGLVQPVRRDDGGGVDARARPTRMVDLGCGSGELTRWAAGHLDVDDALGIDRSPAMLERAAAHASADAHRQRDGTAAGATPRVRFEAGDLAAWTGTDVDLVVANASLHWVPDHRGVLARWTASLVPGGQLAVQVPANADHPSHLASVAVAETEPFLSALGGAPPPDPVAANVLRPEGYADLLYELGFAEQHVALRVYSHVLESTDAVVEWVRGSSLTRFFERLPEELHETFVDAYREELLRRLGERRPFHYTFKRILLRARLP